VPGQLQQKPTAVYNYDDIVYDVKKRLQECYELARANFIQAKQNRMAQQASKVNMHNFYAGDKMLLRNEKAGNMDPLWKWQYVIVEVDSDKPNVIIEINKKKRIKVHVNRLKRYNSKELQVDAKGDNRCYLYTVEGTRLNTTKSVSREFVYPVVRYEGKSVVKGTHYLMCRETRLGCLSFLLLECADRLEVRWFCCVSGLWSKGFDL
jgi:hypothetical protein